jgi:hypothetical protein
MNTSYLEVNENTVYWGAGLLVDLTPGLKQITASPKIQRQTNKGRAAAIEYDKTAFQSRKQEELRDNEACIPRRDEFHPFQEEACSQQLDTPV